MIQQELSIGREVEVNQIKWNTFLKQLEVNSDQIEEIERHIAEIEYLIVSPLMQPQAPTFYQSLIPN